MIRGLWHRVHNLVRPWRCPLCRRRFTSGLVIGVADDDGGLAVVCRPCGAMPDVRQRWDNAV